MSKYYVGQMLDVIKPCGFEVGLRLPITEIMPNGDIVIDSVAMMPIYIIDTHFKTVGQDE